MSRPVLRLNLPRADLPPPVPGKRSPPKIGEPAPATSPPPIARKPKRKAKRKLSPEQFALAEALLDELRKSFPGAFSPAGSPRPALKVGIHKDIAERRPDLAISKRTLRTTIRLYCGNAKYQRVEGSVRVDLDGIPAGVVTAGAAR